MRMLDLCASIAHSREMIELRPKRHKPDKRDPPPKTTEDQTAAFRTVIAYTGQWRVEGNKFMTKVDVAMVGSRCASGT